MRKEKGEIRETERGRGVKGRCRGVALTRALQELHFPRGSHLWLVGSTRSFSQSVLGPLGDRKAQQRVNMAETTMMMWRDG